MLAMTPRNHPHRRKKRGSADDSIDDRETPRDVYDPLHAEFRFTLDVAAARHNTKCKRYYSLGATSLQVNPRQLSFLPANDVADTDAIGLDGLVQPWGEGEVIWCNPPFSNIEPWVMKAVLCEATVVMLLPANRCEQPWWQKWIEPYRDGRGFGGDHEATTRFLPGRRCFRNRGEEIHNRTSKNPPFGIVIVIWDRRDHALAA